MCIECLFIPFQLMKFLRPCPKPLTAALKQKRETTRECEQKKRNHTLNNKKQDMLRERKKNNPKLMTAKKRRHYECKVWPQVARTQQRKEKDDKYDPVRLFGVCLEFVLC